MLITIAERSTLRVMRYSGKFIRVTKTRDHPVVATAERKRVPGYSEPVYIARIAGREYVVMDSDVINVSELRSRQFRSKQ